MTTFGITMVKNEADIIGYTLEHMITQVDHVLCADNLSTDGTTDIIKDFESTGKVTYIYDSNPAHIQSQKMSAYAKLAYDDGADWVVPFDADEYWVAPHSLTIAEHLATLDEFDIVEAVLFDHVATTLDEDYDNPFAKFAYRRRMPGALTKVACRTGNGLIIAEGNHSASYTDIEPRIAEAALAVRHYPYRSPEQFIRKAVQGAESLNKTDLPYYIGQHWRDYAKLYEAGGEVTLRNVFYEHFYSTAPSDELVYDPAVS